MEPEEEKNNNIPLPSICDFCREEIETDEGTGLHNIFCEHNKTSGYFIAGEWILQSPWAKQRHEIFIKGLRQGLEFRKII